LEQLAISGPLNANRIAELRSSTLNKTLSGLLSSHLVRIIKHQPWRGRQLAIYATTRAGLGLLLASGENWRRLKTIFDTNRTLVGKDELFSEYYQKNLMDAWLLMQEIPESTVQRVLNYHYDRVHEAVGKRRIVLKGKERKGSKVVYWKPPLDIITDPYNMLLMALVRTALLETDPELMFIERQLRKYPRKLLSTLPQNDQYKRVQEKLQLPNWFRLVLHRAYLKSDLYIDLIVMLRFECDHAKAQAAIISEELRRLPSISRSVRRDINQQIRKHELTS
jgi:hypothetical protein